MEMKQRPVSMDGVNVEFPRLGLRGDDECRKYLGVHNGESAMKPTINDWKLRVATHQVQSQTHKPEKHQISLKTRSQHNDDRPTI